jgi:hypothetical protein
MVKVESNMLVLDTTFSKQDAEAINHFVDIAKTAERDRIIKLLLDNKVLTASDWHDRQIIALIKGETNEQ